MPAATSNGKEGERNPPIVASSPQPPLGHPFNSQHLCCCRPATTSVPATITVMIHALRVNWADGGERIKRGTNFKQAERKNHRERAEIIQICAVNMWRVRQCCLKFPCAEERQKELCSLLLVCELQRKWGVGVTGCPQINQDQGTLLHGWFGPQ